MKRANGTPESAQTTSILPTGRTVHVSAVQRSNKMKVSGGTQTCSDLQKRKYYTIQKQLSIYLI